ncbi:MAG: Uma2 family endonuclease [Methylococcaceae bacterium]|nr:MAG: Uma2 family endonuclease [Methylococcaceae bacterium]
MAKITQLSQLDLNGTYSYADYLLWQFDDMVELIRGKIMLMSPAPNLKHQRFSGRLSYRIQRFLEGKTCELFVAPFDVKLYDSKKSKLLDKDAYNVVQPDLCVICDKNKLTDQGCEGAPDWIIEVVSKGTARKDMSFKYELYEESGVREYWLVYPFEQALYQFVLNSVSEKYQLAAMYASDQIVSPVIFPDLKIDLAEVFAE